MYNQNEVFVEYSVCSNLSIMGSNLNESHEEENILYQAIINNNLTNRNSVVEDIPYGSLGDVNENMIRMDCTQNLEEPLYFQRIKIKKSESNYNWASQY